MVRLDTTTLLELSRRTFDEHLHDIHADNIRRFFFCLFERRSLLDPGQNIHPFAVGKLLIIIIIIILRWCVHTDAASAAAVVAAAAEEEGEGVSKKKTVCRKQRLTDIHQFISSLPFHRLLLLCFFVAEKTAAATAAAATAAAATAAATVPVPVPVLLPRYGTVTRNRTG